MARETGNEGLCQVISNTLGDWKRRLAVGVKDTRANEPDTRAYVGADGFTRFEIGSVTKGLTGLLVADAVERGEASLDQPLGDVLGAFSGRPIGTATLGELTRHTSGLPRLPKRLRIVWGAYGYLIGGLNPYRGISVTDIVSFAARDRLKSRGRTVYSNVGAAVAGAVLEEVTGTAFSVLMGSRLFAPLGMAGSSVQSTHAEVAPGFSRHGRRVQPWVLEGFAPAGGVVSTLDDMMRVIGALLDRTAPGARSLLTDERTSGFFRLFWIIDEGSALQRRIWHNGQTGGYSALLAVWPQSGYGVAILSDVAQAVELEALMRSLVKWKLANAARPY